MHWLSCNVAQSWQPEKKRRKRKEAQRMKEGKDEGCIYTFKKEKVSMGWRTASFAISNDHDKILESSWSFARWK